MTRWTKRCARCGEDRPRADFRKNSTLPGGLQAYCRPCQAAWKREWREANPEKARARGRRERARRQARGYTPKPKDRVEHNARARISKALLRGHMERPDICPKCERSDSPIQAHHDDYSKPLDIEWLCARCHSRLHHGTEVA